MNRIHYILPTCAVLLFLTVPATADHPSGPGSFPHIELKGTVQKIEPSMLFVQIPYGLRPRTISITKAERLGLHDAKVGDQVTLVVDEGNVMVDAHKTGVPGHGHRIIAGQLNYADPYWTEIKLSTPEGFERFDVDSLAGSKLPAFQEGASVTLELDEANVVIDIHRKSR